MSSSFDLLDGPSDGENGGGAHFLPITIDIMLNVDSGCEGDGQGVGT